METIYDAAVIGSGPAGVSAAINLKLLGKQIIWFGEGETSDKGGKAELIKNYPGLPDVTGAQLMWAFKNHAELMDLRVNSDIVTGVFDMGENFAVLSKQNQYAAKTIILCVGADAAKTCEGEEKFVGKGISYCATCDGFLYKGKTIGVFINDKKFEEEAAFLCGLAKKVYLFPLYKNCALNFPNAEIIVKKPLAFKGENRVERVLFSGGEREIEGMFMLKSALSPATLVKGVKIENGAVVVGRDMSTGVAGVFAAGDCTGRPYQYAKAVGEGNVAAHSAVDYLAAAKNKR